MPTSTPKPGTPGPSRKLTPDEELQLLDLHTSQMLSYRQVTAAWNKRNESRPEKQVSSAHVGKVCKRLLEEQALEHQGHVRVHRQKQVNILEQAMRVVWTIAMSSKCSVCSGEKTIRKDKLDPDSEVQVCPKCDGSGRNEDDATRLSAVGQLKGLLERQAKVLGLDAPVQVDVDHAGHVALDVTGLSVEQLSIEAEGMFAAPAVPLSDVESDAVEVGPGSAGTLGGVPSDGGGSEPAS